MDKIKTSHLIYFFILLFPLINFVLPFLIFGDDMNIRIYPIGSYDDGVKLAGENFFNDKGVYSLGTHQGIIYKINPKNIYISMLYILIFFLVSVFTFVFRNKNLNYDINFFQNKKKKYLQILFMNFVFVLSINYFELREISNLFHNILIILKISLLYVGLLLLFESKNKKELIFFLFLLFVIFFYIIDFRSRTNLPIAYSVIFYSYYLTIISCIFIALKKRLTFINLIIFGIIFTMLISVIFLWKENLRSYSDFNWNKLSKKIHNNIINKPFNSDNILINVLSHPISRINKLDQFSYVVEINENHKILLGKSYIPLISKFIPRQLWVNKPSEVFGNKYGTEYQLLPSYDTKSSVGVSTLIEAYINFRFLGIISLAIFYGLIYRVINYYIFMNKEKSIYFSFLLVMISIFISFTSESNLSSGLGGSLQMIFIAIIYNTLKKKYDT